MILEFWGIIWLLYGNNYKNINFFLQVLNWYRIRELELGLNLDLFELEPRFEEIDGLNSEYNQLID